MNEIVKLYTKDAADNPDNVLEQAIGEYESVYILGYGKDGYLDARASTNMTQEQILWLLETFKAKMMNGDYSDE
jgi:hypothetical protein